MVRIGIDLGTTNSVVCEYKSGKKIIVPINGYLTTPSVVYIEESSGKKIVGHEAKQMISIHPDRILQSTKRDMGSDKIYNIAGKQYTPVDGATEVLLYLKREAEKYFNEEIEDVVITVPAYFGSREIEDTEKAARNAGLNPLRLISEPTSAAIAYGFDKSVNQSLLIVDLGGGTFDVTVLEVITDDKESTIFKEKAVGGNHILGGDDFDNALVEHFIKEGASGSRTILKEEAEKVKIQLSSMNRVSVDIPNCNFSTMITRDDYKKIIKKYIDEIVEKIKDTVKQSGKTIDDINRVVLVGGSCKHPVIQEAIKQLTHRDPYIAANMDTVVAEGAAITHHIEKTIVGTSPIIQIIPISLGIDVYDTETKKVNNCILISKGEVIPKNGLYRALFAFASEGQQRVVVKVLQGEGKLADDSKNVSLGEITMDIPRENQNYTHPVIAVFKIDASNRRLSFTTYEVPLSEDVKEDILAVYETQNDNLLVDWEKWEIFEAKHKHRCAVKNLLLGDITKSKK